MTSRERVQAALAFRKPDKIPIDFGGHRSSGISAMAYARLKKALGLHSGGIYVYDMMQQLAIIEEPVLAALEVDTVELGRAFFHAEQDWKEWTLPDGTPCKIPAAAHIERRGADWFLLAPDGTPVGVQKPGCDFFEQIHYPLQESEFAHSDFSEIGAASSRSMRAAAPVPGSHLGTDARGMAQLVAGAQKLRAATGRAIQASFGGKLIEGPQSLYGMENYLMYTALYPEATLRLSETLCEGYCRTLRTWLPAIAPYIDIVGFGDDLGSNHGPLISPEKYRLYYKPFHARMWKLVKELAPNVKVLLHCCGGIEPLLEDLIDAGLDAVNPVQISARGMQLDGLKARYGGRLTFWGGGCDTQTILPQGTPEQIRNHVRAQVEIMQGEGGFVFQQVHNIIGRVPVENILAMFETVIRYR
ncbi:MAG TPA: uroporphyrinogen decarboxylase family protein [bacterium]|nr:uroporphyrinogen decarboxylase family protein [bacterium]HPR87746.1 uroporphyrinogen decarboxylase family protein [bacterium]